MDAVNTPYIYNVAITSADTEYSQALPKGTKKFAIYAMDTNRRYNHSDTLKVAFTSSAKAFVAIPPAGVTYNGQVSDGCYRESELNLRGKTLYFQSPTGSAYAIIIAWI